MPPHSLPFISSKSKMAIVDNNFFFRVHFVFPLFSFFFMHMPFMIPPSYGSPTQALQHNH